MPRPAKVKEEHRSFGYKAVKDRAAYLLHVKNYLPENPVCIEIGVHRGDFSKQIWEILKPSKLYLVDPWEHGIDKNSPHEFYQGALKNQRTVYSDSEDLERIRSYFKKEVKTEKVETIQKYSYDAVHMFEDSSFDFIYIDATHIYESALADLNDYFPKLKEKGVMAGHDYDNSPHFTVKKAVDEFSKKNKLKFLSIGVQDARHFVTDWALIDEDIMIKSGYANHLIERQITNYRNINQRNKKEITKLQHLKKKIER